MSYTPTAAGHDDAPVEKSIRVTEDLEIAAFLKHWKKQNPRTWSIGTVIDSFFENRPLWTQDRVKRLLALPEFDALYTRAAQRSGLNVASDIAHITRTTTEPIVANQFITHMVDLVVTYDGLRSQYLSKISGRVLHINCRGENTLSIQNASDALIIQASDYKNLSIDAHHSVVVNLGNVHELDIQNTSVLDDIIYITPQLYWRGTGPLFVEQEVIPEHHAISRLNTKTRTYVNNLLEHCRDPHSIRSWYGPTPGRAIYERLHELHRTTE